jgi:hypothetical protein
MGVVSLEGKGIIAAKEKSIQAMKLSESAALRELFLSRFPGRINAARLTALFAGFALCAAVRFSARK